MPWSADEEKRVKRLEDQALANRKHIEELQARLDRDLDTKQHAWTSMLEGAKKVLQTAFAGEIARLSPRFDQLDQVLAINKSQNSTLEDMSVELAAARTERLARKAREDAEESLRAERTATRRHRLKVAAILSPFLLVVVGALVTAAVSQITAPRTAPAVAPSHP